MSGRPPKRVRAGTFAGKSSRESSRKGYQESSPNELAQSSRHPQTKIKPESEPLQPQGVWFQQDQIPGLLPPGKMLLPPLPKSRAEYSAASSRTEKNRTSHACDKCRKAKAKCSGGQPCEKCRAEDKKCIYGDGKRDKERK